MTRTRLKSKFLSRLSIPSGRTTHKNTLVWQWLDFVTAGADDSGTAIKAMRKRVDMPNQFPHKSYLRGYLRKCRLDEQLVQRVHHHLWNLYAEYRDAVLHSATLTGEKGTTRNPWNKSSEASDQSFSDVKYLSR